MSNTAATEETPPMKKVFVVGDVYAKPTKDVFKANGFEVIDDFDAADIFVFTGGADIHPRIYGERILDVTHPNPTRDDFELGMYRKIPKKKAKVGICRGAQLLNALNGGKMWQDVNNHGGNHHALHLNVKGLADGDSVVINSIHHQMMIPAYKAEILGVAYEATHKIKAGKDIQGTFFTDPEVVWYKEDRSFCFQGHPEFGHKKTTDIFFKLLKHVEIG